MTFMPPEWGCLPSSVSKRLNYLLSSLSLCLRFATLTQFPPTSDFRCFVFACQGSIASLAAIFAPSVDGDYTAPEQDSRAAADDRSRGKSYSSFNAATPRYGQCNRQAPHLFELLARKGIERGPFSHVREWPPLSAPCGYAGNRKTALAPHCKMRIDKI